MRLSPDRADLLAARVLQAQRHHRVHLGADARAGRRLEARSRASSPSVCTRSRWQSLLEIVVTAIEKQIEEVGLQSPAKSTWAFSARCSCSSPRPTCAPSFPAMSRRPARCPPRRRSRCACSSRCRCSASRSRGSADISGPTSKPTVIMLPFNIISELSRTLALAIRLFGNMMSGAMILAILLTITPFIFPDRHDRCSAC